MNTNGFVDILNALPTAKLISTVSAGIGKLYEPTHIKRMAKAKAEEIKLISGAMEECSIVPTQYNNGDLLMNTLDWDDFIRRTQGRIAFQELQKQNNIECVVANAYNILESENSCSDEPVEQGWVNSFFDFVSNVSDEDLQNLWGKILAGEIMTPGSFSLRTLSAIRNISINEAKLFQKVLPLICRMGEHLFITTNNDILNKYDIFYQDILLLEECGFVKLSSDTGISVPNDKKCFFYTKERVANIEREHSNTKSLQYKVHPLTVVGAELFFVLNQEVNNDYFIDLIKDVVAKNKSIGLSAKIHIVTKLNEGINVEFLDDILIEIKE